MLHYYYCKWLLGIRRKTERYDYIDIIICNNVRLQGVVLPEEHELVILKSTYHKGDIYQTLFHLVQWYMETSYSIL